MAKSEKKYRFQECPKSRCDMTGLRSYFEMLSMFIANIYVIFDQWYNKLLKKYNFNLLASAKKELSKNTVWKIMKRHGVTFQLPFFLKFTITQSTFIAA